MSLAAERFLAVTSSRHRLAGGRRSKMAAAAATTSGEGDEERWVALNKDTFLDILNDILTRPAVAAYQHTPEVTSRAPVCDLSPTRTDRTSISLRSSPLSGDSVNTSGLRRCTGEAGFGQSIDCVERLNVVERTYVDDDAKSPFSCPWSARRPASSDAEDGRDVLVETAADLTTVDRRRPALRGSAESANCATVDDTAAAVVLPELLQQVGLPSSSAGAADEVDTATDPRVPGEDLHSPSVTSSSRDIASCGSWNSASGDSHSTSGTITKAEVSPRASWMAIDKTLLCDVINKMLYREIIFDFCNCRHSTFPFPVDRSSSSKAPCGREMTTTSTPRLRDGRIALRDLPCPRSSTTEPEIRFQSLGGGDDRPQKRLTPYAVVELSSSKRRCHERSRRDVNLLPLPLYLETRRDDDTSTTDAAATALSPSLKWKSTMLLRMRRETPTDANRSLVH